MIKFEKSVCMYCKQLKYYVHANTGYKCQDCICALFVMGSAMESEMRRASPDSLKRGDVPFREDGRVSDSFTASVAQPRAYEDAQGAME